MKVYKQIPRWWYFILLACAYAIAQATNYGAHSNLPWWALTVILIISLIFSMLFSILAATLALAIPRLRLSPRALRPPTLCGLTARGICSLCCSS